MDARKLLAELVGTFVFFLIGLMSILSTRAFPGGADLLVIAFGFGLGLFVAIKIGGHFRGPLQPGGHHRRRGRLGGVQGAPRRAGEGMTRTAPSRPWSRPTSG